MPMIFGCRVVGAEPATEVCGFGVHLCPALPGAPLALLLIDVTHLLRSRANSLPTLKEKLR